MNDDYRHRTRVEVIFRDIDSYGHVNNAVTSTYIEQARVTYMRDVLGTDPIGGMPLILAMIKIDYIAPIFFADTVEIGTRVDWVGRSSFGMSHLLRGTNARELARASGVLVHYDYAAARPSPVPNDWRQALVAHEGRSLERPAAGP
ncbi:MAG: thioesterase family protein [Chloroflexota bacterium]